MAPRRRSRKRSSGITRRCWGVSEEPESPWREIGQYHARGVVPLRRRPLRLYEMTVDWPPWTGTVTVPSLLSPLKV
jgi:hypothetical protein